MQASFQRILNATSGAEKVKVGCPHNYLRGLFRGCLKRHNWEEDYEFDWSRQKSKLHLYSNAASPMCGKHSSEKYRFMINGAKLA